MTQNQRTFIVRFRQMHSDNQPTWIVSLQNAHTGQQVCFPSVEGLVRFLQDQFPTHVESKDYTNDYRSEPIQN